MTGKSCGESGVGRGAGEGGVGREGGGERAAWLMRCMMSRKAGPCSPRSLFACATNKKAWIISCSNVLTRSLRGLSTSNGADKWIEHNPFGPSYLHTPIKRENTQESSKISLLKTHRNRWKFHRWKHRNLCKFHRWKHRNRWKFHRWKHRNRRKFHCWQGPSSERKREDFLFCSFLHI